MRSNTRQEATEADERLTDDDYVVVDDEHFAVDVDELCDQASLQLGVSPQAGDGDVVHPLVVHWRGKCQILHCITTENDMRSNTFPTLKVSKSLILCVLTLLFQLGDDRVFPSYHGPEEAGK